MKLLAILTSLFLTAGIAWVKEASAQIKVNGMTCDACAISVKAALLGPHAEEIINLFALAIKSGIPASDLHDTIFQDTIFGYPTVASDVRYML